MSHESHSPTADAARGPGYEVRDTNVRVIIVFILVLFGLVALLQWGLWGLLHVLRDDRIVPFVRPDVTPTAVVDEPALPKEFGINEQLRQLRSYETKVLAGKAPAGKSSAGTVLPIDQAIDLLAERGLPPQRGPLKTEAEVAGRSGAPVAAPRVVTPPGATK